MSDRKRAQAKPWPITPRQAQVLDALISAGSHRAAASKLALNEGTIGRHVSDARAAMGCDPHNRYDHVLWWDRYRRRA